MREKQVYQNLKVLLDLNNAANVKGFVNNLLALSNVFALLGTFLAVAKNLAAAELGLASEVKIIH